MTREEKRSKLKRRFVIGAVLKGILVLIPVTFFLWWFFSLEHEYEAALHGYIHHRPWRIYVMLFLSEMTFGIFPVELFIAALDQGAMGYYILQVIILANLSYSSGIIFFQLGHRAQKTTQYRLFSQRKLNRPLRQLKRFGPFLIVLASLTPISFAITSFLAGLIRFSFTSFLYYSAVRYLRFAAYAFIAWRII